MFWKGESSPWIDEEIDRVASSLRFHEIESKEYRANLMTLDHLYKMKEEDKSDSVLRNNVVVVVGNLLGILMIVKHEHVNVITSRAVSLLLKPILRA
jgi:hypothetical protein